MTKIASISAIRIKSYLKTGILLNGIAQLWKPQWMGMAVIGLGTLSMPFLRPGIVGSVCAAIAESQSILRRK